MMTLAQRVRDFRYAKGWGPDELASRAEISRTALYQIESGKTGLPRAGTLRRIAVALDVSMNALLGEDEEPPKVPPRPDRNAASRAPRSLDRWFPGEGGPLSLPSGVHGLEATRYHDDAPERPRSAVEHGHLAAASHENPALRERELMVKLHELLMSPVGSAVARVLDELHGLIPRTRNPV